MFDKIYKIYLTVVFFIIFISQSHAEVVKKIEIIGNDRISNDTIILFSEVSINDEINDLDLNNLIKNLFDTNYFEDIKVSLDNGILKINVIESPIIGQIKFEGIKAKKSKNKLKIA